MDLKKIIIIIISFSWSLSYGESFSTKDFKGAVGLQASSLLYKRGIITYEGFQVLPIYSLQLFHPDLILAGSALYYKKRLDDRWSFRTRLNFDATGDDPLYFTSEEENQRIRREETTELDLFLEYTFRDQSLLRLTASQDLVAHDGQYFEIRGRWVLGNFLMGNEGKALLQPALFSAIGYGTKEHNQYFYGSNATTSGFNNLEYGLVITSPKVIDSFWPTFKLTRFSILGESNRNASFVQEKNGWSVEALAAFNLW